jgi:hypothetical protein
VKYVTALAINYTNLEVTEISGNNRNCNFSPFYSQVKNYITIESKVAILSRHP